MTCETLLAVCALKYNSAFVLLSIVACRVSQREHL